MTYLLRAIDPRTWTAAKRRADRDGLPLSAVLRLLIAAYASGRVDVSAHPEQES